MAIVNMRKLQLIAMSYDKDAILNALQRTGAVEVKLHAETENTVVPIEDAERTRSLLASVENALTVLTSAVENYQREHNQKPEKESVFDVTYTEFMSACEYQSEVEETVSVVNDLADERNRLKGELSTLRRKKEGAQIYAAIKEPLSSFGNTYRTQGRLGCVATAQKENLKAALNETELCAFETLAENGDQALLFVSSHVSVGAEIDGILSTYGFADCPYTGKETGEEIYRGLELEEKRLLIALNENVATMYAMKDKTRLLKIYCDYLSFTIEKAQVSEKLRATERTFLLEAYVPETAETLVQEEIKQATGLAFIEFTQPTDEETPPTLLKNNSLVGNFEGITNSYSVPNYREFDPNAIMAFFYSLFMGFIIGDIGYGLLMVFGGGYLWWKNRARPTGMSRLAGAFAIGGIFAVIWGALFNSLFGFSIFSTTIMPDAQEKMWALVGIKVPAVLIIAMLIGIVQLFTGYVCKAVQAWRRGQIADGIFDGLTWAVFSVGVALAIIGLLEITRDNGTVISFPASLVTTGGILAGVGLLLAVLTAGRKEKFAGKFTKGFGAAYSVINYASDILSYARLYGLMLSGAVIAKIIADYGGGFVVSGNVLFIILGIVLLVVGNAFNLVMNLLGAYIHDARLQYVEFYGRFYEGDGELFKPLGGEHKYVYLLPTGNGGQAKSEAAKK